MRLTSSFGWFGRTVLPRRPSWRASAPVNLLLLLPLVAACAGPQPPLDVAVRGYPISTQFGAAAAQLAAPPIPPVALPPAVATLGVPVTVPVTGPSPSASPPLLVQLPPVAPPPPSCPAAGPFAAPALVPGPTIGRPPAAADYPYRDAGSVTEGSTNTELPVHSSRRVQDVTTGSSGAFSFQVASRLDQDVTTTTYSYTPPSAAATSRVGNTPTAGLYITQVSSSAGGTWTPTGPGFLLFETPYSPGTQWQSSATDPQTATTMAATVTEGQSKLVNACGQVVDAVDVHLNGSFGIDQSGIDSATGESPEPLPTVSGSSQQVSPGCQTKFTADYAIAPQYGGLSVMDTVDETLSPTAADGCTAKTEQDTATIDVVPKQ